LIITIILIGQLRGSVQMIYPMDTTTVLMRWNAAIVEMDRYYKTPVLYRKYGY
jgi:hypothetical protein